MNKISTINPFTIHTQEQGVTYMEHWYFAMGIAGRLLISVMAFAIHAILPFIEIKQRHDLEATMAYLNERNEWIESQKSAIRSEGPHDYGNSEPQVV